MTENNVTTLIPIIDNYFYNIDANGNHTLYFKQVREVQAFGKGKGGTGKFKEFTEELGYMTSMAGLFKKFIKDAAQRKIEGGEIQTVKQHLEFINEMTERIEKIANGF